MIFFFKMGEDKVLPVFRQKLLAAVCLKNEACATLARLHAKVHLGIMTQRLIMTNAFNGVSDSFFIYDFALSKFHIHVKPGFDNTL